MRLPESALPVHIILLMVICYGLEVLCAISSLDRREDWAVATRTRPLNSFRSGWRQYYYFSTPYLLVGDIVSLLLNTFLMFKVILLHTSVDFYPNLYQPAHYSSH